MTIIILNGIKIYNYCVNCVIFFLPLDNISPNSHFIFIPTRYMIKSFFISTIFYEQQDENIFVLNKVTNQYRKYCIIILFTSMAWNMSCILWVILWVILWATLLFIIRYYVYLNWI